MSVNRRTQGPFVCRNEDVFPSLNHQTAFVAQGRSLSSSQRPRTMENDTNTTKAKEKHHVPVKGDHIKRTSSAALFILERQMMKEYELKNKELYLAQFVRQNAITDLKMALLDEEQKLKDAERKHEEEAVAFEEYQKAAEKMAKEDANIAKGTDLLKAEMELEALKRDIRQNEETLREYRTCEEILKSIPSTKWWEYQTRDKPGGKRASKKPGVINTTVLPPVIDIASRVKTTETGRQLSPFPNRSIKTSADKKRQENSESKEEWEPYFTDPNQLYNILEDLKRQNRNLNLIAEEFNKDREKIRRKFLNVQEAKSRKIEELKQQVKLLTDACVREEDNTKHLQLKAQMFSFDDESEVQNTMLRELTTKIGEVYNSCINDVWVPINMEDMLSSMESYFDELLRNLMTHSKDVIKDVRKKLVNGKRQRAREEKFQKEKLQLEDRQLRAMQSTAEKPKPVGRKLMIRSKQSPVKKKNDNEQQLRKEHDEEQYFFA